jgi:hypothetical protein
VPAYRVCFIGADGRFKDSTDGRFTESKEMICRDDGEAVVKARRLLDGHDLEVWSGNRFVIRLTRKSK